jgi:prepilin-type N-terminal cleavage/methylation domain-containing protein
MTSKKLGVTLVEVLVVMTIIAILSIMMVMVLNPISNVNKARDAQRKKDLSRIRIAFEEYNNDKGCYPGAAKIAELTDSKNCGSKTIFSPWLSPWPCDPNGWSYVIVGQTDSLGHYVDCSKTYRVAANLDNKKDKNIPDNWYIDNRMNITGLDNRLGRTYYLNSEVNYGVSSDNLLWYDLAEIPAGCDPTCNVWSKSSPCKGATGNKCQGDNCYMKNDCDPTEPESIRCKVAYCDCSGMKCIAY